MGLGGPGLDCNRRYASASPFHLISNLRRTLTLVFTASFLVYLYNLPVPFSTNSLSPPVESYKTIVLIRESETEFSPLRLSQPAVSTTLTLTRLRLACDSG